MDGIGNLASIMGSGFSSLTSLVKSFDNTNKECGTGAGVDYSAAINDLREKLEACGVEVPENTTNSFSVLGNQAEMQQSILDLSKLEEKENKRAQIEMEREADKVELAKSEYFSKNSYAVDDNGNLIFENGQPKILEGVPEDSKSAAARAAYEKEVKYQAQLAALDQGEDYTGMDASKQLNELYSDYNKMNEYMSSEDGQAKFQELIKQANIESQNASISADAAIMRQTLPPALKGMADTYESACQGHLATARDVVANSPEQTAVNNYNAQMKEQIAQMREQMNAKIQNFEGYQLDDLSMEFSF